MPVAPELLALRISGLEQFEPSSEFLGHFQRSTTQSRDTHVKALGPFLYSLDSDKP